MSAGSKSASVLTEIQLDSKTPLWSNIFMAKEQKEPFKTTVLLDPDTHERVRILAIRRRTSLSALTEQALREFLKREEKEPNKGRRKA